MSDPLDFNLTFAMDNEHWF